MMKHILNKVRRMNHKAWRKFKFPLLDFDIWGDFPPLDDTKDELVILEVDLSKPEDYEEAMNRLKNFFIDCEMVTRGLLQCKGREPKRMTGKTGKDRTPLGERDKFIEWLKDQDIKLSIDELEENWDYIQNRILAEAASNIWGKEFFFIQLLDEDVQIQEALKHFDEARALFSSIRFPLPTTE